jgi:hypothetical protein
VLIEIPEEKFKKIREMESKQAQNSELAKLALEHVKKYGYDIGRCNNQNINVTYNECLNCGIRKKMKMNDWNKCTQDNITYKYTVSKKFNQITDEKIIEKIKMTPQEKLQNGKLYVVENGQIKTN